MGTKEAPLVGGACTRPTFSHLQWEKKKKKKKTTTKNTYTAAPNRDKVTFLFCLLIPVHELPRP